MCPEEQRGSQTISRGSSRGAEGSYPKEAVPEEPSSSTPRTENRRTHSFYVIPEHTSRTSEWIELFCLCDLKILTTRTTNIVRVSPRGCEISGPGGIEVEPAHPITQGCCNTHYVMSETLKTI